MVKVALVTAPDGASRSARWSWLMKLAVYTRAAPLFDKHGDEADIDALVLSLDALAKAIGRNAMATADDILVRVGRQSQRVKDRDIGRSQTEYRPHSAAGAILMAAGAIFSLPKTNYAAAARQLMKELFRVAPCHRAMTEWRSWSKKVAGGRRSSAISQGSRLISSSPNSS